MFQALRICLRMRTQNRKLAFLITIYDQIRSKMLCEPEAEVSATLHVNDLCVFLWSIYLLITFRCLCSCSGEERSSRIKPRLKLWNNGRCAMDYGTSELIFVIKGRSDNNTFVAKNFIVMITWKLLDIAVGAKTLIKFTRITR